MEDRIVEKDFYKQHPKSITDQPLTIITNPPYGERLDEDASSPRCAKMVQRAKMCKG